MGLINWSPSHKHRSLQPPAAAAAAPWEDFLQLTSMTIFYYRRAAEARAAEARAAAAANYWPLERKKAEKRREKVKTSGGTRKPLIPCVCSR